MMAQRDTATFRVKGSVAPDGKDVQPVVYDFDLELAFPLRDVFAAFALAGLIANHGSPRAIGGPWLAAEAYHAADAMMQQRAAAQE